VLYFHQVNQVAMVKFIFNVVSNQHEGIQGHSQNKGKTGHGPTSSHNHQKAAPFLLQIHFTVQMLMANGYGNSDGFFWLVLSVIWPAFVSRPWLVEIGFR